MTDCRYPVILSIENHCSLEQQQILVNTLKSTLADKLYSSPVNGNAFNLPSPEELKHKILLKVSLVTDTHTLHDLCRHAGKSALTSSDNSVRFALSKHGIFPPSKMQCVLTKLFLD